MNFEEWLCQHNDMPEIGDYEIVKDAWNQALEEAAKVADESYSYCQDMRDTMCNERIKKVAKDIRQLKTKE